MDRYLDELKRLEEERKSKGERNSTTHNCLLYFSLV